MVRPLPSLGSQGGAALPFPEALMDYATAYALILGTVEYEWCACGDRAVGEGLSRCVLCEAAHANAYRAAQGATA